MHGMVEGARGRVRKAKQNMAHRHCRVDGDWDYNMCDAWYGGRCKRASEEGQTEHGSQTLQSGRGLGLQHV